MITLYGFDTVNTLKILILLEEVGADYDVVSINIRTGAQHAADFRAINPNGKVPVITDDTGLRLTESGAILLHLAERFDFGLSTHGTKRDRTLEWLTYQLSTQGPIFGQIEYWRHLAPDPLPAVLAHYARIGEKIMAQMDARLADNAHFAGDEYSIADIAIFSWMTRLQKIGLSLKEMPHLSAWYHRLSTRSAVQRALMREQEIAKAT